MPAEPVDTINDIESVSATGMVADAHISVAKPSRFASSLAFLQHTPYWTPIAPPAPAVALGDYGCMQKHRYMKSAIKITHHDS